jgi:hypothetical protein
MVDFDNEDLEEMVPQRHPDDHRSDKKAGDVMAAAEIATDDEIRAAMRETVNGRALLAWFPCITKDDIFQMLVHGAIDESLRMRGKKMERFIKEHCGEIVEVKADERDRDPSVDDGGIHGGDGQEDSCGKD